MALVIITPGPLTSVQDLGRVGYAANGYPECGACDPYALVLGNLLCGNEENAAALEFTLMGPSVTADMDTVLVLTGGVTSPAIDGQQVSMHRPFLLRKGQTLTIGPISQGLRGYLCAAGGVDVPVVLGSRCTDMKSRIGGVEGRALCMGDQVPIGKTAVHSLNSKQQAADQIREQGWAYAVSTPRRWIDGKPCPVLRCIAGPQEDAFTDEALSILTRAAYTLTPDSNRMGVKLSGAVLPSKAGVDIISDGILSGVVQVSANGQPIIMMADHQTTGGYAKIATVLPCDLSAAAQVRPGETVFFRLVTMAEGMRAMQLEKYKLAYVRKTVSEA